MANRALLKRQQFGGIFLSTSNLSAPIRVNHALMAQITVSIILGIAAGYRIFGEGRDFRNYHLFYQSIWSLEYLSSYRYESGFVFLAAFFKLLLNANINIFFASVVTLSTFLKLKFLSQYKNSALAFLFYFCCWYPIHEYTQIRAAIAFSFIFIATGALFKGRVLLFAILVGVGFAFHGSALALAVAIPAAYALSRFRLHFLIAGGVAGAIATLWARDFLISVAMQLNPIAITHIQNVERIKVNLFSGVNVLTLALLASIVIAGSLRDRRDKTFFILAIVGLGVAIVFQDVPVFSHRLREMFLIFLVPLAFNMRRNLQGYLQFITAAALSCWYLYSHYSQEIILS